MYKLKNKIYKFGSQLVRQVKGNKRKQFQKHSIHRMRPVKINII